MKNSSYNLLIIVILLINATTAFGQLQFEAFLFEGYNSPLLDNASSIAVSPSESHLYVTSYDDQSISLFQRDLNSGELTFTENYKNDINDVAGLLGVNQVAVSPDGRHVYACGVDDDAIAVFDRDEQTGELEFSYQVKNSNNGSTEYSGLNGVSKLQFSEDGNYLFAISGESNSLTVFKRNVITGYLENHQQFLDGQSPTNDLNFPVDLTISADGRNVYVVSQGDNALSTFNRNTDTGMLTYQGAVSQIPGFFLPKSIEISPMGNYIYASGETSIVSFQRNISSGQLSYLNTYSDNVFVSTIGGVKDMMVSENGEHLLTVSTLDDAVTLFDINNLNGDLSNATALINGSNGVSGLNYPVAIEKASSDQLYVASFGSNALVHLNFEESTGEVGFLSSANTSSFGGLNGISGAKDICVSPDGNHAYAAGELDDAITTYLRDHITGEMTHISTIEDGSANDGINGVNTILCSSDGAYIYAAGYWDHSVAIFERDQNTGLLTYLDRVKDNLFNTDGLNGVRDIVLTNDGTNMYSAGYLDNGIGVFGRNVTTGMLDYQSVMKDGVLTTDGLANVIDLALSPDDQYLYAAANGEAAISIFERSMTDGSLTYVDVLKNTASDISGLEGITAIELSPDGMELYVSSQIDNAIVHFSRDPATGLLTFIEKYQDLLTANGLQVLDGASDLQITTNGMFLFATAANTGVVSAFSRDQIDGSLTLMTTAEDGDGIINGTGGASSVTLSPEGKFIYVSGETDAAVAIFSCTIIDEREETICEGDSYQFGNDVLTTAGQYEQTIEDDGCVTIIKLTLNIHPTNTEISKTICTGDAITVGGEIHNTTGEHSYNLTSSFGCDSIVTLNLTVADQFPETINNVAICANETYEWNGVSYETSGQYQATFTSNQGCDSAVVLNLEVLTPIEETIFATGCGADFYVFGTSNYIESGTYIEVFTAHSGCDSIVTLNLDFSPPAYSQEATICQGEIFELGGETYDTEGDYVGELLLGNGCIVDVYLSLTVTPAATSTMSATICEGEEIIFNGVAYTETGIHSAGFPIGMECDSIAFLDLTVNSTSEQTVAAICQGGTYEFGTEVYSETGVYEYTEFNNATGCEVTYTLNLQTLSIMEVEEDITPDDGTGIGAISIDGIIGGEGPYDYDWSNGETGTTITDLIFGDYTLTITDANGCFSIFEFEVSDLTNTNELNKLDFNVQLLPNLVEKGEQITLKIQSKKLLSTQVIIIDNTGVRQHLADLRLEGEETTYVFEAPKVAGMYYIQLKTEEGIKTLKLSVVY